ncbi:hypothetical protein [Isoptericola halotolerans]|uniref:Uncharacterized protein n=1 Tax=Isoptericola halotolerans TaxID=300560 RepID=A0ABX2A1Z9_9MICO|nr:hypothetical protein [Isoptericola halotolerans]NOV95958.1 hypothetical protein [Isoptericola halotolerans]
MRRRTADDDALPPDDGWPVPAPQGGFPFAPVGGGGAAPASPWESPPPFPGGPPTGPAGHGDHGDHAEPAEPAAGALPWASAVPTDVPALDDVFGGSADSAASPEGADARPTASGRGRRKGTKKRKSSGRRSAEPASPPSPSPSSRTSRRRKGDDEVAVRESGTVRVLTDRARTAVTSAMRGRRATGLFARRATLFVAGGLALVAGVGAGAAADLLGRDAEASTDAATAAVVEVTPEVCAAAQVAWSRAASAQVRMDVESPRSLRTGFVGARDALSKVDPPGAVITDWATVLTYVTTAADATQDVEDDEVEDAVAGALAELDTDKMTAASQRITEYLGGDCAP